jgi:hypothetical protein
MDLSRCVAKQRQNSQGQIANQCDNATHRSPPANPSAERMSRQSGAIKALSRSVHKNRALTARKCEL